MAKDDKPAEDNKPAPADQSEPAEADQKTTHLDQKKYGVALVVGLVVVLAFAGGAAIERTSYTNRHMIRPLGVGGFVMGERRQGGPRGGGSYRLNSSDNNASRLSGVVTAVNGSTFTIAGHGTTNSVQTTSSTQFTGGDKVAVNDSVSVIGTTSSGTFTASHVAITP